MPKQTSNRLPGTIFRHRGTGKVLGARLFGESVQCTTPFHHVPRVGMPDLFLNTQNNPVTAVDVTTLPDADFRGDVYPLTDFLEQFANFVDET